MQVEIGAVLAGVLTLMVTSATQLVIAFHTKRLSQEAKVNSAEAKVSSEEAKVNAAEAKVLSVETKEITAENKQISTQNAEALQEIQVKTNGGIEHKVRRLESQISEVAELVKQNTARVDELVSLLRRCVLLQPADKDKPA